MSILSNLIRITLNKFLLRYDIYFYFKILLIHFLTKLSFKNSENKSYEDVLIFMPEGLGDITIFKSIINKILILNKKKKFISYASIIMVTI